MEKNNYEIKYTQNFKREIENVFKYIVNELQNEIAAENILQLIEREIKERSYNPENYKPFRRRNKSTYIWYRININNYSAFYTVKGNVMTMRRFLYSKRNLEKLI